MKAIAGIAILAIGIVGATASSRAAAGELDVRRITVSYGDLDPSTAAGKAALMQRVQRAVERVCDYPGISDQHTRTVVEACSKRAMAATLVSFERQLLARRPGSR